MKLKRMVIIITKKKKNLNLPLKVREWENQGEHKVRQKNRLLTNSLKNKYRINNLK